MHFELVVKNVGGKHAELNFADGQAYDFVVADSAGRDVWQWSNGRIFTQSVQNKQLGGGESMRVSESWNKHDARAGQVHRRSRRSRARTTRACSTATFVIP